MAIKLFNTFRAEGIAVESWPDLAPEIQKSPVTHQVAFGLRDILLFFPVFHVHPADVAPVVRRCLQLALQV